MTPLNENDMYDLRLRAEQSLMLLGGTEVRVKPEELLWLVEAITDSASNEDLEAARGDVLDREEEIRELEREIESLQRKLDAKEAA